MTPRTVLLLLDGFRVEVRHRRRYGRAAFFTWLVVVGPDGARHDCGDPWPCVRPSKADCEKQIALVRAKVSV